MNWYILQDKEMQGDPIYRQAENENEALNTAKKQYPNVDFNILNVNELIGI